MNPKIVISFIISLLILSCNPPSSENLEMEVIQDFEEIDVLLDDIAKKPQHFSVPSNKESSITGKKGTIIHIIPDNLKTKDGSPLSKNIEIELLELCEKSDLLANRAPTTSNGNILETGGAYYIKMSSSGKELEIKKGENIKAEFPKLSEKNMELFYGKRDSLGQINWIPSKTEFATKSIPKIEEPKLERKYIKKTSDGLDAIFGYIEGDSASPQKVTKEEVSKEKYDDFQKRQKEYKKRLEEIKFKNKTYEAIELTQLGWINCDSFYEDPSPKKDIQLLVSEEITSARIFAIFQDIESVMSTDYSKSQKNNSVFSNIPTSKKVEIIAIGVHEKEKKAFVCHKKNVSSGSENKLNLQFKESSQEDIKALFAKVK